MQVVHVQPRCVAQPAWVVYVPHGVSVPVHDQEQPFCAAQPAGVTRWLHGVGTPVQGGAAFHVQPDSA